MPIRTTLSGPDIETAIDSIAREILAAVEQVPGAKAEELCLVGIRRGGIPLAQALTRRLEKTLGRKLSCGSLDIGLYRDDQPKIQPTVGPTEIPLSIQNQLVVLVDDVLFTGRTIRAALDELMDFGRPRRVFLAVLVDRGGHELPIAADFVGHKVECASHQKVEVRLGEGQGVFVVE